MGYNSRFEGSLTPSKPIPDELVERINLMDLDVRVVVTASDDSCGEPGDVAPWASEMHGYALPEDILRVQRLLTEQKTGITLSGSIYREGDSSGDFEKIEVVRGRVYSRVGEVVYGRRQKVSLDRWAVKVLRKTKSGGWQTCGWVTSGGCSSRPAVAWSTSGEVSRAAALFTSEDDAYVVAHARTDKRHKCEVVKTEAL